VAVTLMQLVVLVNMVVVMVVELELMEQLVLAAVVAAQVELMLVEQPLAVLVDLVLFTFTDKIRGKL